MKWLLQRIKVLIRGVACAIIIAMPFTPVASYYAPTVSEITYNTNSPYFLYNGVWNPDFTMTWYDVVTEGGTQVAHGEYWNDNNMRVHNNDIQYKDPEYGWIPVVALNINQMKEFGTGRASVVNSEMHGSVIEIEYPNGTKEKAIVLDVCGSAKTKRVVDRWVYDGRIAQPKYGNLKGISFRFVRFGFDTYIKDNAIYEF